jgi:hypothetical protein
LAREARDIDDPSCWASSARKEKSKRTYESARALADRAVGPLSNHLGAFVTYLIEQQYAASVIYIKVRLALAFDRWLAKRRIVLSDLGEVHIERFQNRTRRRLQRIRAGTRQHEWRVVTHVLCFLRAQDRQGLATGTIERYGIVARQFLEDRFGCGVVDLGVVRAADTIAFVKLQSQRLHPPALKCVVNALRSFLRYAQYRGDVPAALVAAVPRVSAWSTTPVLPRAISPEHA